MNGMTIIAHQVLLCLHTVAFAFSFVAIVKADLDFVLNLKSGEYHIHDLGRKIMVLLAILWGTGIGLIFADLGLDWSPLLEKPKLLTKLTVVTILTLNGILVHYIAFPCVTHPQANPKRAATFCVILGAISSVSWFYAAFVGLARIVAPMMTYHDFLSLYVLALFTGLVIAITAIQPRLARKLQEG